MVFGIPGNGHLPAIRQHRIPFRYAFFGIVGAFGVNVGLKLPQYAIHRQRIKQEHIIHAVQSGEDFRALRLGLERAVLFL